MSSGQETAPFKMNLTPLFLTNVIARWQVLLTSSVSSVELQFAELLSRLFGDLASSLINCHGQTFWNFKKL